MNLRKNRIKKQTNPHFPYNFPQNSGTIDDKLYPR